MRREDTPADAAGVLGDAHGTVGATVRWAESSTGRRYEGFQIPMRRIPSLLVETPSVGKWEVTDETGETVIASPGRILVVPPDAPHSLMWRGDAGTTEWWMLSLSDGGRRHPLNDVTGPWIPSVEVSERVLGILRSATRATTSLQDRITVSLTALSVLDVLLSELPPLAQNAPVLDHRIKAVLEYIDNHLDQPLPRDELARIAYLSPTRFHYVFVENIGVPPSRYVMTRRLDRARQLLGGTDASIKEIGTEVGFIESERFSRAFHARIGISPSRYRSLLRDQN